MRGLEKDPPPTPRYNPQNMVGHGMEGSKRERHRVASEFLACAAAQRLSPWPSPWSTHGNSFKPPHQPSNIGTIPTLIFQTRKQRHREIKSFVLGHTACKGLGCTFHPSGFTVFKLTYLATLIAVKIWQRERKKKSVLINDKCIQLQGPKRDQNMIQRDCGV